MLIAVAGGVIIWRLGLWGVRLLATPQPPALDPEDTVEVSVAYRCTVCGMQLTVTHAADGEIKAPRHCREEMDEVPVASSE